MDIGVSLPSLSAKVDASFIREWAQRAEAAGFSSLHVRDRVVHATREPLAVLALAAGLTSRIRLLGNVLVPTRETTLLARTAATIDNLSGGRLTLGVGVGSRENDYLATGVAYRERGRLLDEELPILRKLWRGEPLGEGVGPIGPAPARPGGPELLIGGAAPAMARRIAAWGDGFQALVGIGEATQRKNLALWRGIEEAWTAAERAGRPRLVAGSFYALGPDADAAADRYIGANFGFHHEMVERFRRDVPTSLEAIRETVRRQADLGVDELILMTVVEELPMLDALADAVQPFLSI